MSDIYEPFERLIAIELLGRQIEVPANNTLLRQLQWVCPDVGTARFCWNGDCRECEIEYAHQGTLTTGLACRLRGCAGMRVVRVSAELRSALASWLASHELKPRGTL